MIECPYCEFEQSVNHDDGQNYDENIKHQMECVKCRKSFVFYTAIHFYYYPEKADCLNGKKHKWKLQNVFPKEFTKMECEFCGEIRNLTDKERKKFKIDHE